MKTRDLVFQASAIMLIEDCRCHEDEQVAFVPLVVMALKRVAQNWNVSKQRHLRFRFGHLIGNQSPNCESVAALNQNAGIQCARVDDRTRDIRAAKNEVKVSNLIADLRLN